MLGDMLRGLAEVGAQAEWLLIFLAAMLGVLMLVCAVAAFVAMFSTNREQQQICFRIFCTAPVLPAPAEPVSAVAAGRRPGRPGGCHRDLVIRMYRLHYDAGLSYERISDILNAEGVPLPAGGSYWLRSSIERVMNTNYGREIGKGLGYG